MSSSPPEKKRKSESGEAVVQTTTWRDKSIERFGLKPVPNGWKSSVAVGSDEAWRRYYQYRVEKERARAEKKCDLDDRYDSDGNSIDNDGCDDPSKEGFDDVLFSWVDYGMENLLESVTMGEGCVWQWTPHNMYLSWDDETITSANYYAHVWSPFSIPHAIKLNHSWYGKVRYSGSELNTDWNYVLLDFEDNVESSNKEFVELCSFSSDSGRDVIKTSKLNKTTSGKLRKFLYGANTKKSKELTCPDKDFLLLLFGSMGSTDDDLERDAKSCSLGYSWCPWEDEKMKQKLFDEKAPENDDPNGKPPAEMKGYSPRWCSWLRHRILEVSDSLGPISKHYQPKKKTAASVSRDCDEDSYGYGGYGSDDGERADFYGW